MKKITAALLLAVTALLFVALTTPAFADDVQTITGKGCCAKCALHETDTCQNALQVEKDGKTITYYIKKNDVSNDFHKNICKGPKQITVTGTVKDVDGKKEITPTKIELAE